MTVLDLPEPPNESVVGTPARRPNSVRRTAHINMVWPGGFGTPLHLRGRARDLVTTPGAVPTVHDEIEMVVEIGDRRAVEGISTVPQRDDARALIGGQGGERFRSAIDAALPGEREAATPLHFLLDDIAGVTVIAPFAWWLHRPVARPAARRPGEGFRLTRPDGRIICSGLRPDGFFDAKMQQGVPFPHFLRPAGDLSALEDPWAWHDIEPAPDVCMRRRRRLDAWMAGSLIVVDAHHRDSMWDREHVELAVHEYTVQATIDPGSHILRSIVVVPRVLPFPECPWASAYPSKLVGLPVEGFRTSVQDTLDGVECCTHLNDMLRGLAEVPVLMSLVPHG